MQVGRLAVKSSTQRPHCKSLEHAGDGEQIPAAARDWFKNLSCLCTFVSDLGADWLLFPELDQWASVAPDAKRRPTAAMPVWTWSHDPGRGRRERRRDETHQRGVDPGSADLPLTPLSPACSQLSTQQVGPVFATNVGSSPTWPDSTPPTSPQCFLEKPAQNGKQTFKLLFSVCVCAVRGPIGSDDGRSVGRSPRRPLRGPPRPPPHRVPVAGHISRPRDCRDRRDCVDESPAGPGPFCNRHLPLFFRCSHEQTTRPWTGLTSAHPIVLHKLCDAGASRPALACWLGVRIAACCPAGHPSSCRCIAG